MYSVIFSDEAKDAFSKLEREGQKRILSALERCRVRPDHFLKRLVGSPYYRLRAGNYRIIIDLQHEQIILLVVEIAHRKKAYKVLYK